MEPDNTDVRRTVLSVLDTCSQCQGSYAIDDIRIVGRNGNLWVLTVTCSDCQTQAFVAAVVGDQEQDDDRVEQTARSEASDSAGAAESALTVDDVLDMHEFLESFDGDFHSLFYRRRS